MKKPPRSAATSTIALLFLVPALLFLFVSCGNVGNGTRFPVLLQPPFSCRAEGEVSGKEFSAHFSSDGSMTYDTPQELAEITVSPAFPPADGSVSPNSPSEWSAILGIGSLSLPGDSLPGLSVALLLLSGQYEVTGSGTAMLNGNAACFVCGVNRHGDRKIWLSPDGIPLRIYGTYDGISADFTISEWYSAPSD